MGCGGSTAEATKPGKRETVFGVFDIRLKEAHIQHETSSLSAMDPYVVLKFSNQIKKGEVVKKGGINPQFKDKYSFFVNSHYKHLGRTLEVQLMDSNIGSDDVIGYGIIDLDPYLNQLQVSSPMTQSRPSGGEGEGPLPKKQSAVQSTTLRCFLNFDRKQAGVVTFEASFKEQPVNIINFRFETAQFQRSTRTFGDMQCFVRVTVGQEVLETKKSKDTATDKPVWKQEFLTFSCPKSLEKITIEVMDENKLVGAVQMNKNDMLIDDTENQFCKEIIFEGKVAGKLWFNTKKNANVVFKTLNGDYKKKQPQAEKKEEKKQKKKEEKKQEEKKQEQKKQEKKEEKKQQEKKVEEKKSDKKGEENE